MKLIPVDKKKRLIITRHALERMAPFGYKRQLLREMFYAAVPDGPPPGRNKYEKYKENTRYYRFGSVVMVVADVISKDNQEPVYLLVTAYDQKLDVESKYL